jgi:hypothetical protein
VVKLEGQAALAKGQATLVGDVGVPEVLGKTPALERQGELPSVDGRVPADRLLVAVEVSRHVAVSVDDGPGPASLRRLGLERDRAVHVVHVMVREHRRGKPRLRAPAAHRRVDGGGFGLRAGIEHDEPVPGVEGVGAGDALEGQNTIGDLLGRVDASVHGMVANRIEVSLPHSLGQIAESAHG